MEVYVLDEAFRRVEVVDRFESLIWTDRYLELGDFELNLPSTSAFRSLLTNDTRLAINTSKKVMEIENVLDKTDSEGRKLLNITGRSLEKVLDDRVGMWGLTPGATWALTNTPGGLMRWIFQRICKDGALDIADKLPYYTDGTLYPADTIAEPVEQISVDLPVDTVLNQITKIGQEYGIGFRLYRGLDTSKIYFNVYTGSDRTTSQTSLPPVIFSEDLDNLSNVSQLTSTEEHKNVAYVFAPNGVLKVYADDVDPNAASFSRRILKVDASDIELPAGTALTAALTQRGKEALATHRVVHAMDGELMRNTAYRYEQDYFLGDLVEMRSEDGSTNRMRVTENIQVDDREGERSYPTLSLDLFVTPGAWFSWDANQTWDTVGEIYWDQA